MPDRRRTDRSKDVAATRGEETKICPVCRRPFANRKKWRAIWDQVVYCSDRCRRARNGKAASND